MIREDRFVLSHRPYAAKVGYLRVGKKEYPHGTYWSISVPAVWFKGPRASISACLGSLWGTIDQEPGSLEEALELHTDGRYGGHCHARLNAGGYWSERPSDPATIAARLEILEPMLAAVGELPEGYSGWWRF